MPVVVTVQRVCVAVECDCVASVVVTAVPVVATVQGAACGAVVCDGGASVIVTAVPVIVTVRRTAVRVVLVGAAVVLVHCRVHHVCITGGQSICQWTRPPSHRSCERVGREHDYFLV